MLSSISAPCINKRVDATSDDTIIKILDWCSAAYIRHGIKLNVSHYTDLTKTYQWRYAKAIARKFAEWRFDEIIAQQFIDVAVEHARISGVLRKGLAVLHQNNMMNICYQKFNRLHSDHQTQIDSLITIRQWLQQQINGRDPLSILLYQESPTAYCNLIKWYCASKISPLYLALSRCCGQAMMRLADKSQLALLPDTTDLYLIRQQFIKNINNVKAASAIFASDWRSS